MVFLFVSLSDRTGDDRAWKLDVAVVASAPSGVDRPWTGLSSLRSVNFVQATRGDAEEGLRQGTVAAMLEYVHFPPSGTWHIVATAPEQWHSLVEDLISVAASSCDGVCADVRLQEPPTTESTSLPWLVAGVLTMAFANTAFFVVAQNTTMARQDGSLLMYAITPITSKAYFVAEVSVMSAIAFVQSMATLVLFMLLSDFTITGSWILTVGVVVLTALALLGVGLLVAGIVPRATLVFAVAPFLNVLCLAIGNVFWPASNVEWLRPLVLALPTTYAADALRQTLTNEDGLFPLWLDLAVLVGILTLAFVGVARWFRFDAGGR